MSISSTDINVVISAVMYQLNQNIESFNPIIFIPFMK